MITGEPNRLESLIRIEIFVRMGGSLTAERARGSQALFYYVWILCRGRWTELDSRPVASDLRFGFSRTTLSFSIVRRRNLVKFDDAENNFVKIYAAGFGIQDVSFGNSPTTFELS